MAVLILYLKKDLSLHDVQVLMEKIEKDKNVDEVVRLTDEQFRPTMRAADSACCTHENSSYSTKSGFSCPDCGLQSPPSRKR